MEMNNIQTARIVLGMCPTCGIQTHQRDSNNNLVPLSNENVLRSRCLLCNPIPNLQGQNYGQQSYVPYPNNGNQGFNQYGYQNPKQQEHWEVNCSDGRSQISSLSLESVGAMAAAKMAREANMGAHSFDARNGMIDHRHYGQSASPMMQQHKGASRHPRISETGSSAHGSNSSQSQSNNPPAQHYQPGMARNGSLGSYGQQQYQQQQYQQQYQQQHQHMGSTPMPHHQQQRHQSQQPAFMEAPSQTNSQQRQPRGSTISSSTDSMAGSSHTPSYYSVTTARANNRSSSNAAEDDWMRKQKIIQQQNEQQPDKEYDGAEFSAQPQDNSRSVNDDEYVSNHADVDRNFNKKHDNEHEHYDQDEQEKEEITSIPIDRRSNSEQRMVQLRRSRGRSATGRRRRTDNNSGFDTDDDDCASRGRSLSVASIASAFEKHSIKNSNSDKRSNQDEKSSKVMDPGFDHEDLVAPEQRFVGQRDSSDSSSEDETENDESEYHEKEHEKEEEELHDMPEEVKEIPGEVKEFPEEVEERKTVQQEDKKDNYSGDQQQYDPSFDPRENEGETSSFAEHEVDDTKYSSKQAEENNNEDDNCDNDSNVQIQHHQKEHLPKRSHRSNTDDNTSTVSSQRNEWSINTSTKNLPATKQEADVQFQEGWDHLMGDHYKIINRKLGQSLIVEAMEKGSKVAEGFCRFRGWGDCELDHDHAFGIFASESSKSSHDSCSINALAMMGYFCRNGYGTAVNFQEAIRWFAAAAKKQHSWAMAMLAFCYQEGEEINRDDYKAFRLYKKSAELGYAKAMFNLGELYLVGAGVVDSDEDVAMVWYKKAALMDYVAAKEKLEDLEDQAAGGNVRGRRVVRNLMRSISRSKSRARNRSQSRARNRSQSRDPSSRKKGVYDDDDDDVDDVASQKSNRSDYRRGRSQNRDTGGGWGLGRSQSRGRGR